MCVGSLTLIDKAHVVAILTPHIRRAPFHFCEEEQKCRPAQTSMQAVC